MSERTLTDADVAAIVASLKHELVQDFHESLGKGVWGVVWKGIVAVLCILAAWGASTELHRG